MAWLLILSMYSDRLHLWHVIDQGSLLIFRSYFYPTFIWNSLKFLTIIFENHRFILTTKTLFILEQDLVLAEGALLFPHNVEGHVNCIDGGISLSASHQQWFSRQIALMACNRSGKVTHFSIVIDQGSLLIFRSYFYPTFNEFHINF